MAWHPDGTSLISASADETVRVWRLRPSGVESQQIDGFLLDADWHPDKQTVAVSFVRDESGGLYLWDLQDGSTEIIYTNHFDSILRAAWSPDGEQIATASFDIEVHIYDVESGERLHRLTGHTAPVSDTAWSPDGRQLASAAYDHSIRLWNMDGEIPERFSGSNALFSVTWHPDRTYFAAGAAGGGYVNVWDIATSQRYDWDGHGAAVVSTVWHPSGQWLASGGQNGQIIIWDTAGDDWTTGRIWKEDFDLGEQVNDLAWEGNLLAAAGVNGSIKVWDVVTEENVANYSGHDGSVRAVDWSHDGRYLATVGMTDGLALVHYARFETDLLPMARDQLMQGSRAVDRERCLAAVE